MAEPTPLAREFARDVRESLALQPKQLYSKYLYDALGSHLFEAICRLPWYPVTRAESRLLSSFADQMVEQLGDPITLVELGCGSGEKISIIAEALRGRGGHLTVHLIDISRTALEQSERTLGRLQYVSIVGHRATYEAGLRRVVASRRAAGRLLVLFLGSNIGNFDPPARHEFLSEIRGALHPGDALLLGADLVKPEADLLLAYDDPLGVTAAFDKNLLVRINRELGGEFDLASFDHRAVWNARESRVEMHLVSRHRQTVRIAACDMAVSFDAGESIWTESSYKFAPDELVELATRAGFTCQQEWVEPSGSFCTSLFVAA
jgi:dimethylhistidine N-methyltransferase